MLTHQKGLRGKINFSFFRKLARLQLCCSLSSNFITEKNNTYPEISPRMSELKIRKLVGLPILLKRTAGLLLKLSLIMKRKN